MSFRDRGGQQPNWDDESDGAPPIWEEHAAPPRNVRGRDDSFGDLPAWPKSNRAGTSWDDDEVTSRSAPDVRQPASRADRQSDPARWPSLRDSLRGHADATQSDQRTTRYSSASPSADPARSRTGRHDRQPVEDEYVWPDESSGIQAEIVPYDEPRRQPRRTVSARTQTRARRSVTAQPRPRISLITRLGSLTAGHDTVIVGSIGISIFSLLVMAAVVSTRSGAVSPWFATHINASGEVDRWATSDAIWRLPLMTAIFTLGSILTAIYIGKRDVFASRFLVASMVLIHLLSWMGMIRLLW